MSSFEIFDQGSSSAKGLVASVPRPRRRSGDRPLTPPANRQALIAAFVSPVTAAIGREVGLPVAVLAAIDDPERHAEWLSDRWHAAWTAREGWFAPFDYGLNLRASARYTHAPFDERWLGRKSLPNGVFMQDGCLRVETPGGMTRDVAEAFARTMSDLQFDRVAHRPGLVQRRHDSGRRLDVAPRYACDPTRVPNGREVTRVEDLYHFGPRLFASVAERAAAAATLVAICRAFARSVG